MNSPPPRHTWREFLGIRFDHHVAVQERTDCDHTHTYSAINCPPAEEFIRQSDPDPTIVERILESFYSYLERKGCLDDLLPIDLDSRLYTFQCSLRNLNLVDEPIVMQLHARLLDVVYMAVVFLTSTDAEPAEVNLEAPSLIYSQQGDSTWVTINSETGAHIKTMGIEGKRPRVLFRHATGLQLENDYAPSVQQVDEKAMATKIWLHLASSTPPSRFGYFFTGISAVIVEKVLLQPDHNALLVSPHFHLFRDDNPLTSAEHEFITADRCCEKGIPLLAILTSLHLPNESVCRGICPAVRNVIDVQQMRKALRALPRPMTAAPEGKKERSSASNRGADGVSVGTTRASTISFRIEYLGMTRLPRLLVPQMPRSAPPVDTAVLSLSSTSSCSTTDSEDHLPSSSALPSPTVDVEVSDLLSYGPVAQVWRGCLSSRQGTVPVIAKIFSKRKFDDMKNEVLVYQLLSSHHLDDLAPLYYGVFTMPDQSWGAIVLSDAGKAFRGSTWKEVGFSAQELRLLWKHVKTLHSLGVHHHDLQPRNVAKGRDGNLRLLDYERSSLGGGSCSCEELSTLEEIFDSLADWRQ